MNQDSRHEPVLVEGGHGVVMVRDDLGDVPRFALPDGYTLRWFEPGDEEHWYRIHRDCEGYGDLSDTLFAEQFGTDNDLLSKRMAFIFNSDDLPVATNAAWFNDWNGKHWGRVHWVATSRSEQGKGLSKPLMTVVCKRLRELGHTRAYLTTNTMRVRAICLYAEFGFEPYWDTDEEKAVWEELIRKVRQLGRQIGSWSRLG